MPEDPLTNSFVVDILRKFLLDGDLTKDQLRQAVKDHKITLEEYTKTISILEQ